MRIQEAFKKKWTAVMLSSFLFSFSYSQAKAAGQGFQQLTITCPNTKQVGACGDTLVGAPLTDLKEIRIYRRYFECPGIVKLILVIPAVGKEGQQISFQVPYSGSGNCGELWPIAVRTNGIESCKSATYVFASQWVP